MAKFLLFLLTTLALAAAIAGGASAAGWNDDDLPQRQEAMKEALRVMSNYNPAHMAAEKAQQAMAFMNGELEHLRPIAMAVHSMPENSPAEIRAKEEARRASHELLTQHLSKLLPGGSVKITDADL